MMRNKKTFITITILLLIAFGISCWTSYRHYQADQEVIKLKSDIEDLEMDYSDKIRKLETTKTDLKTVKQERDDLKTKYTADELYIQELEKRYMNLYSYAMLAEEILIANGIEFRMVEGGLDYKSLRGENQ